jgi:TP901 family phage tail tape measure protein
MKRVGGTLTRNVTAPLALIGGAAIKAAGDFESSFADIRKTVTATEPEFAQMSSEIRELAKTIPTSVNELNKLGGVAGQLGVEADNIVEFTKTMAMLGDTTDIAGEQAALSLSRFMNVMGTAAGDIDRLGSTIVGLGNNFAAMESEIVEIGTSLAPLGNSIGLTEQQVLAFSTAIAASGGKTEAASTAFQKTASSMKQAVISGGKELEKFAKITGQSADEFQQSFKKDASGAILDFLEGLGRIQKEGGSTASVLEDLGLADQRLQREFGKLTGNIDQARKAMGVSNDAFERNTALTEEAQKRYATFNSRVKILWNNLYDLGVQIGNALMPAVNSLIDRSKSLIGWFSDL